MFHIGLVSPHYDLQNIFLVASLYKCIYLQYFASQTGHKKIHSTSAFITSIVVYVVNIWECLQRGKIYHVLKLVIRHSLQSNFEFVK